MATSMMNSFMNLLWTNESGTSATSFDNRDITVAGIDAYPLIGITFYNGSHTYMQFCIIANNNESQSCAAVMYNGTHSRTVRLRGGNVLGFGIGYASGETNQGAMIPYQIYGIK